MQETSGGKAVAGAHAEAGSWGNQNQGHDWSGKHGWERSVGAGSWADQPDAPAAWVAAAGQDNLGNAAQQGDAEDSAWASFGWAGGGEFSAESAGTRVA